NLRGCACWNTTAEIQYSLTCFGAFLSVLRKITHSFARKNVFTARSSEATFDVFAHAVFSRDHAWYFSTQHAAIIRKGHSVLVQLHWVSHDTAISVSSFEEPERTWELWSATWSRSQS